MAKTKHGLQETTGIYKVRGIVSGVEKEKYYTEKKTKTNKDYRAVNFGLEVAPKKTVYVSLNGMPKDVVYFSGKDSDGKNVTEKVTWEKRNTFDKNGYSLMGVTIGLEKDADGKNVTNRYVEYDACEKIATNLKDGDSVFSQGKLEFSSFQTDNGISRSIKFVPTHVYGTTKDIDFNVEDFKPDAGFRQQIVFMGIDKKDDYFIVKAKIVTYSSIEDAEFYLYDSSLANLFRKNLKPYNAIQVHGHIEIIENVSTVEDEDTWGDEDPTERKNAPTERRFVITGAKGKTLDKDTYTKESVEEAIKKLAQSESAQGDWGKAESVDDVEDEEW